ncbi:MAG TPA: T9SS type A sorting domain-containing protein, partial [Bacteroidia bacterium]|nr:T9SS type A sorting domain-containing protein [Bacteroidia bacterium]
EISSGSLLEVNNFALNGNTTLYPNPNNGSFQLGIRNGVALTSSPNNNSTSKYQLGIKGTVEIYNMLGEKVYSNSLSIEHSTLSINLGAKSPGLYMYKLISESGEQIANGKFVIE